MNKFTEEQNLAIESKGKTIVSASAGSGKTTVMIEKIVRLIKSGVDVNQILAMTYTKKAAAQMKDKLKKELIKAINDKDISLKAKQELKHQLPKVAGADLSTIHSFCSRLIRSHFFAAGVDSGFSIADDADSKELQNRALDRLFDEAYENATPEFLDLLAVYFRKKRDSALREVALSLYLKLRTLGNYREILQSEQKEGASEEKFNKITEQLFEELKEKCDYYLKLIQKEKCYFTENGLALSVRNAEELSSALSLIILSPDYFSACKLKVPKFSNKQTVSKSTPEDFSVHADALGNYKTRVQKIYNELLDTGEREEELARYLCAGKTARSLAWLLIEFDKKYEEEKSEKNVLDYNDLEHVALKLLSMSDIAAEIRQQYAYVFVDEYQDVNPVQEKILSLLSGDNIFLVGDVKQSIYAFRGSKSKYFVEKQKIFEKDEKAKSLRLTKNFRSASEVLCAVNNQFSLAMTTKVSEVDYKASSIMESGGRYEDNAGKVEIDFLPKEEKSLRKIEKRGVYSVEKNYLKAQAEISAYGEEFRRIIERERNAEWFDADENKFKKTEYSDIAVLVRKKAGDAPLIAEALTLAGIPVSSASEINLCDYPEIKTLIDILSLIDNPRQDISLCSALLSSMGNLTANDLTDIRLAYPAESFYRDCVQKYATEKSDVLSKKLAVFFEYFEDIRTRAAVLSADEVLTALLTETKMETRLLSFDNGTGCLKRIGYFISQSAIPASQSVHDFLDRLKTLAYNMPYSENGGENAVRIMTMHASKGLEFPVVILNNLNEKFRGKEEHNVRFDEQFGIAPKAYDRENMIRSDTLLWRLCIKKERAEDVKNELNLFYVAMTRAKYALHMVFADRPVKSDVKYAESYADFLDFSVWQSYIKENESPILKKEERNALVYRPDEAKADEIAAELAREYPYAGCENLPVKTSASVVLSEKNTFQKEEYYSIPALFDDEKEKPEDSEKGDNRLKGLAYHAFLQHYDFMTGMDKTGIELSNYVGEEIERMRKGHFLTDEEIVLLEKKMLVKILSNRIFKEVFGMRLYRERQFLVCLSVKEVYGEKPQYKHCENDEIILQGAIDLLAESDEKEYRIVDYKYSLKEETYLQQRYAEQLLLYKKAVVKITGVLPEKVRCTIVNIRKGYQIEIG